MAEPHRKKHCATVAASWSSRLFWAIWKYGILPRLPRQTQRALRSLHSRLRAAVPLWKTVFEAKTGVDPAALRPDIAADLVRLDGLVASGDIKHYNPKVYDDDKLYGIARYYKTRSCLLGISPENFPASIIQFGYGDIYATLWITRSNPHDCALCGKSLADIDKTRTCPEYLFMNTKRYACAQCAKRAKKHRQIRREEARADLANGL